MYHRAVRLYTWKTHELILRYYVAINIMVALAMVAVGLWIQYWFSGDTYGDMLYARCRCPHSTSSGARKLNIVHGAQRHIQRRPFGHDLPCSADVWRQRVVALAHLPDRVGGKPRCHDQGTTERSHESAS